MLNTPRNIFTFIVTKIDERCALRTYCTPRRGEKIVEDTDFPESSESEGLRNAVST